MNVFDDKVSALFLLRRAKFQGLSSEALAVLLDEDDHNQAKTDWSKIKRRLEDLLSPA
ncbi:MAG: hypothetical protein AAF387_01030 [Pseudomonadota bacterium]